MKENEKPDRFQTSDLRFVAYAVAEGGLQVTEVKRQNDINTNRVLITLEPAPDSKLIRAWLSGQAPCTNAARLIDSYRHLLFDVRAVQYGHRPVMPISSRQESPKPGGQL